MPYRTLKSGLGSLALLMALLLPASPSLSADVAVCDQLEERSQTFLIRHKVSGKELTVEDLGTRDDRRNVMVYPSGEVTTNFTAFIWFFETAGTGPVPGDDSGNLLEPSFFYIYNLKTGFVLTQNPSLNVGIWPRVEGDHNQQWRLDSSAEDGTYMIINRASGRGLLQTHNGTKPDKLNVETWQDPENQRGGFSWYLEQSTSEKLWKLSIDGWNQRDSVSGFPSVEDDVRITANGRKILPLGADSYENCKRCTGSERAPQIVIHCASPIRVRFWDYDFWSGDDLAYTYDIDIGVDGSGTVTYFDQPDGKREYRAHVTTTPEPQGGINSHLFANYQLEFEALAFLAHDPTRPNFIELVIEGEPDLPSYGRVEANPGPVGGVYARESSVTLTAVPEPRAEFVRWQGRSNGFDLAASCGNRKDCEIVVAEDTRVEPVFRQMPRLTVDNLFAGSSVTFNPPGTNCANVGYACQIYATGTQVALEVTPGLASSEFLGWEGDADPVTGVVDCEDGIVTLTETTRCRPVFKRTGYNLRVDKFPPGSTVLDGVTNVTDKTALEINCGADCEHTYPVSEGLKFVELTATAIPGFTFVGWDGASDCYDEDEEDGDRHTALITVGAQDIRCTAVTVPADTELVLRVQKIGGGTVTATASPEADSSGIDCGEDSCTQTYPLGTQVQLTATATRGSEFAGFDTLVGSDTFTGNHEKNVCEDGLLEFPNATCIARFNSSVLIVYDSGQFIDKEQNDYISSVQQVGGLDYDFWNVAEPNSTSNPGGRTEPLFSDLASYGRVLWFSGDAKLGSCCGSHGAAGPSLEAEAELAKYLDGGGCLMLSSPEYFNDRGLTDFAKNYLGVAAMEQGADTSSSFGTGMSGSGSLTSAFSGLGPFSHRPGNAGLTDGQSDTIVHNPDVKGSGPLLHYVDGSAAAVGVDTPQYRSAFLAFPFLALSSGNARHDVMKGFMDFCEQPEAEEDDGFEVNDSFDDAYKLRGLLSQKDLKRLPGNDDYFHWTATAFSDVTFSITFAFEDPLALEVYDSTQSRILEIAGADFNHQWLFVAGVESGQKFTIRVFGDNEEVSAAYSLDVRNDGDRDYDGVADSVDGRPDDPDEQFDTDGDSIGDKTDDDDDGDGMPDAYEAANGFDPLLASDADLDEDRDGFSNLKEFMSGTDPLASDSTPVPNITVDPFVGAGATAFAPGDGEQVVLSFSVVSDSTDAEIHALTLQGSGDIDEATDVGAVNLYRDENSDGVASESEKVGSGSYTVDNGEISFILAEPYPLPVGETQFLVTYEL